MRLKCVGLAKGVSSSIFFWEEGEGKDKRKAFKRLGAHDEFDVQDQAGHEIIAKYKGCFEVVHYGEKPVAASEPKTTQKATVSPRTKVVKQEATK